MACCEESVTVAPNLSVKYIQGYLYITYNGTQQQIYLPTGGGSGGSNIESREQPITVNEQVYFNNVISEGETVDEILINGVTYTRGKSFEMIGTNLTWTGAFILETTDTMILKIKTQ